MGLDFIVTSDPGFRFARRGSQELHPGVLQRHSFGVVNDNVSFPLAENDW